MRSPPVPASHGRRRCLHERTARHLADDPCPGRVRRLRSDLEGPDAAAHAAHVGHERDPWDRHRRRDHRHGHPAPGAVHADPVVHRGRARVGERRRGVRRHRPDARDVQEAARRARVSTTTANLLYLFTIVAFILALRFLSSPRHARLGVQIGAAGMLWAVIVTLSLDEVVTGYWWMAIGMAIGSAIGVVGARRVKMTAMPQMVALFNGVGGGAASIISLVEFHTVWALNGDVGVERGVSTVFSALVGSISFAGSLIAFGKLQDLISGRPITYPGQQVGNALIFLGSIALGAAAIAMVSFWLLAAAILVDAPFGVVFVLPIGGADMPVVISLLNAFTGLAAAATGFVLHSNVLIVSGMLVGASGTLLTTLMARAMNRSITNVLFGAFGKIDSTTAAAAAGSD